MGHADVDINWSGLIINLRAARYLRILLIASLFRINHFLTE